MEINSQQQGTSSSANSPAGTDQLANQDKQVVSVKIDARYSRNGKFLLTKMAQHFFNAIRGRKKPTQPVVKSEFDQLVEKLKNDEEGNFSSFADTMMLRIDNEVELGDKKAVELMEYDEKLLCFITFAKPFYKYYRVNTKRHVSFMLSLHCAVQFPEDFLERLVNIILHTPEPEKLVNFRLKFEHPMKWPKKLGHPAMLIASDDVKFVGGNSDGASTYYQYALVNQVTKAPLVVSIGKDEDVPWYKPGLPSKVCQL